MEHDQRIRVAIRIRPALERERYDTTCSRKLDDGQTIVMTNSEDHTSNTFGFDYAFDESDDQQTIYEEAAQDMVDAALQGANVTIFTYGQTGSGKTYTILGKMSECGSLCAESGLFLRVFGDLFEYRRRVAARTLVLVSLAAVELYVDDVMDLLANKAKIRLRESGDDTLLPGLNMVQVGEMRDVMQQFRVANSFRSVASTKMNDASSRSHALFLIDVFQIDLDAMDSIKSKLGTRSTAGGIAVASLVDENGVLKNLGPGLRKSRIALVDLAGSERVKRSGVEGQAMVEAQAINKSLSTLGTVINAMYLQSAHVPFRECKLTKVLKVCFVDKASRLLLIGQVAPSSDSLSESLGSLRFCDRVKNLKAATNSPFVDPEQEAAYLQALKNNEAICADLRIAHCMHYYALQRPRYHAMLQAKPVAAIIADILPSLQATAPERERVIEEVYMKQVRHEAIEERDTAVSAYRQRKDRIAAEVADIEAAVKTEREESKKHKAELAAASDVKMTEAKKVKKSRLAAEDKVTKLKSSVAEVEKELGGLRREMSVVISPSTRSRNNFDDDSDDDGGGAPVASAAQTAAASSPEIAASGDAAVDDDGWRVFEGDWEQAEANHEVVSSFYFHVKALHPLHMQYVLLLQSNWVAWGEANRQRFRNSEVLQTSTLIPDIIAFVIERSVLIAEDVIRSTDTFAWFDIDGMSRKLKSPGEMYPPLLTDGVRDPIPLGPVESHVNTFLDDTEDESEERDVVALTIANRQQLGMEGVSSSAATTREARERRKRMKGNGVTKKYDTDEADRQYLMTVYDSCTLVHDVTKYLKAGTVMLKHGRNGKPHNRLFWVTAGSFRMELVWIDQENKTGERTCINLSDVGYVSLGCFGKVFRRHPYKHTDKEFFMCFSIGLKDGGRTVDIVASTLPDFEAWVLGLCHLARIDPHWGRPLDITGFPEARSLLPQERTLCETHYIFPADYLRVKDKVVTVREEVQMHLRLFGNDHEQAFAALGGIHLPQLNDRGAMLMTKGELRFHCSPFNIDIFRVCRMWMLFHELGILYDPSFTPPTNFGVVCR